MIKKLTLAVMLSLPLIAFSAEFPSVENVVENSQKISVQKAQNQDQVKSAEELATDLLDEMDLMPGWNEKEGGENGEGMMIAVGVAKVNTKSLAPEKLVLIRPLKYTEASLYAKADIIKAIRVNLSAENRVMLPETGMSTEFDRRRDELNRLLAQKTKELQESMKEAGAMKEDTVGDVSKSDLYREGIAAVLNKLGWTVEIDKLKQAQAEKVRQKKAELLELQAQIDALKKEIEDNKAQLSKTSTSEVETLASMPLSGAMALAQFESLKNDEYQVAVVVGWSPEHAKYITDTFAGKPINTTLHGTQTFKEYLNAQKPAMASSIGGRKFIDKNGVIHILGIGASPIIGSSSAARDAAKISAEAQAQSQVAYALYGDVKAWTHFKQKAVEAKTGQGDKTDIVQSAAQDLSESVKNLQIHGLQKRFERVLTYPLTNQKILVNVVEYSYKNANLARNAESDSYHAAAQMESQNKAYQGEKAGKEAVVKAAQNSRTSYQAGYSSGMLGAQNGSPARQSAQASQSNNQSGVQGSPVNSSGSAPDVKPELREGSFMGGGVDKSALMF
ncbi:hypothetical protein [Turicimonas muris]|uniref:hypothetical protein n=1 Tax=Turicimonas muris TaxID=1796652 RepID=UPI0023F3954A|nr:hypothetical protein [Turicimonas muris]